MRRTTVTLLLSVCAASATGCDKLTQKLVESTQQASLAEEEQLSAKLSLHAQCTNASRSSAYRAFDSFANSMNEDGTPQNPNGSVHLGEIGDHAIDPCNKAAADSPNQEPSLPDLEQAQKTYTDALVALAKINNDLDTYFKQEDYKDDEWGKSKELTPKYVEAFKKWDEANQALDKVLDAKEDEANTQMLKHIEDTTGKNARWHTLAYLGAAKGFIGCLEGQKLEAGPCKEPYAALEKTHEEFTTYVKANKAETDQHIMFSSFEGRAEEFYTGAKKFMRALDAKEATPELTEEMIEDYNEVIDWSNRVQFRE